MPSTSSSCTVLRTHPAHAGTRHILTTRTTQACIMSARIRPICVPPRIESKRTIIHRPQAKEEIVEERRTEDEIEDAVPDHLACRGDDVPALAAAPGDGVEHSDESNEPGAADVA